MDYAQLGSELEHSDPATLAAFARKHRNSPDATMAELALFASFLSTAKCERLAGRIDAAMLSEADAERCYKRLPAEARW